MNKRDLKAYVRYDGSGRVVAGSLILRKNKPKVGKWKELTVYECCNPPITQPMVTYTVTYPYEGEEVNYIVLETYCDGNYQEPVWSGGSGVYSSAQQVVDALNSSGIFGEWSAVGNIMTLTASADVELYCGVGTNLSFQFFRDI